jgi:aminomethyltransferase
MTEPAGISILKRTPLFDLHVSNGGRMVPFAGYEMPLHYAAGIIKEHLHTRSAAGLFDVSHMGQISLRPRPDAARSPAAALERLLPADIVGLASGRQRYALLTNEQGGILDDLMVANLGDCLILVVNAATKEIDERYLRTQISADCVIESLTDRSLLALQGPLAEQVLARFAPGICAMGFMDTRREIVAGTDCVVSRSGYTGEDGFEISVSAPRAEDLARALLENEIVRLVGLGARDSLRLEAGLCLSGADIDAATTPVEAALEWSIPKSRRAGGVRCGGFPGADIVMAQLAGGATRRRMGLRPEGRAPTRAGTSLYADETSAAPIGTVSSGGFGPSIDGPIAMAYVDCDFAKPGTRIVADVRGKRLPVVVQDLPFVPSNYLRRRAINQGV